MLVVAALIRGHAGRFLLQRRPSGRDHAGLWEFPGGKVEPGESPRTALIRELEEELGLRCDGTAMMPVGFADRIAVGEDRAIAILLYSLDAADAAVTALEGGELGWFTLDEMLNLPMPPLDVDLLASVCRAEQGA
ncbi:MAG: (deoxy)nucleoside triphosphate pyrophosphohydrolase [Caenibius sp.]